METAVTALAALAVAGLLIFLAVHDGVTRRRMPLVADIIAVAAGYTMWALYLQ